MSEAVKCLRLFREDAKGCIHWQAAEGGKVYYFDPRDGLRVPVGWENVPLDVDLRGMSFAIRALRFRRLYMLGGVLMWAEEENYLEVVG